MLLFAVAFAFLLPFKIKKPYLAGKIGIAVAGLVEFLIILMGVGLEVRKGNLSAYGFYIKQYLGAVY